MRGRLFVRLGLAALLAALTAVATRWFGWPGPAVVGAAVAAAARPYVGPSSGASTTTAARDAAVGVVLGWAALLAWALLGGRAAGVAAMLGGLVGVRGSATLIVAAGLALLTLALGAMLAWSAATVVAGLLDRVLAARVRARAASAPGRVSLPATHTTAAHTP